MSKSYFMGKPISYWIELDNKFGDVKDNPYLLLVAAEARLDLLDSKYENEKHILESGITKLRNKLGFVNGK